MSILYLFCFDFVTNKKELSGITQSNVLTQVFFLNTGRIIERTSAERIRKVLFLNFVTCEAEKTNDMFMCYLKVYDNSTYFAMMMSQSSTLKMWHFITNIFPM